MPGPDAADDPVVWYEGSDMSTRRWLLDDERGSVIALTDSTGNVIGTPNTYDEYGVPGGPNQGRFQYTGQLWIPEMGLYHYKARIYSPTLGRFMQTDPVGYISDLNWYAYAGDDPVNLRDPSGSQCVWDDGSFDSLEGSDSVTTEGACGDAGGAWVNPQQFANHGIPSGAWTSPGSGLSQWNGNTLEVSSALIDHSENGAGMPASLSGNTVSGVTVTAQASACTNVMKQGGGVGIAYFNGDFIVGGGGTASLGRFRNLSTGSSGRFFTYGGGIGYGVGGSAQAGYYNSAQDLHGLNANVSGEGVGLVGSVNYSIDGKFVGGSGGVGGGPGLPFGATGTVTNTVFFDCVYAK